MDWSELTVTEDLDGDGKDLKLGNRLQLFSQCAKLHLLTFVESCPA